MPDTITLDLATCRVHEQYTVLVGNSIRYVTTDQARAIGVAANHPGARVTRVRVITTLAEDVTGEVDRG